MATVRERQTGVWEIRVFTGRDADGRPTQISKTVRGTKRDAKRVAAQLESQPNSTAAGRTVTDVLDSWREVNDGVWSAASKRDYASRAAYVEGDSIGRVAIARLTVADVERWHSRMRRSGVGESAIRSRHSVLRAALAQAVRWGWVGANVAAAARLRHGKRQPRESMTADEVRRSSPRPTRSIPQRVWRCDWLQSPALVDPRSPRCAGTTSTPRPGA